MLLVCAVKWNIYCYPTAEQPKTDSDAAAVLSDGFS